MHEITFTLYQSTGPLSKQYWLEDGVIQKQAAAQMYSGTAERVTLPFKDFPEALKKADAKTALGYGLYPDNYPGKINIVQKGQEQPRQNSIARTKEHFQYRQGEGVLLIDYDPSEYGPVMTPEQLLIVLIDTHPAIGQAARIVRGSVSAGVHKKDKPPGTGKGFHVYIPVANAADIPRFGAILFNQLWLAGWGFIALAANGALLERTAIDGAVFSPERLDFVGKPIISGEGLEFTPPEIVYIDGGLLDTESLQNLTDDEKAKVAELKANAKEAIKPKAALKQRYWAHSRIKTMQTAGVSIEKARETINRILSGGCQDLYDDFILEFSTGPVRVAEMLLDPQAYDGRALSDPIEGREYGTTTAKFYWNNGKPVIHSLAHGQDSRYFLHEKQFESTKNKQQPPPIEPEPLRAPIPKAEYYPVEALGDVLGAAAKALNKTIKAPLALCCQSVLASSSLAAQAHFDVMLPWGEKRPLSLYLLTVAESGERKSGVDDVVLGAAKAQERQDMDIYDDAIKVYESELAAWKEANQEANKNAAKAKTQAKADDAAAAIVELTKPEKPVKPLRFVSDPTVEGLYKLMVEGQPSLGLFSDEAGLLIGGHALNSDNSLKTMSRFNKFWDGSPFDRVRGGDDAGVLYGRRLAMHQLAQPEVMAQLLGDRMANGQGFLARCLVAWPESTIGSRHIDIFEQPRKKHEIKRLFAKLKTLTEAEPRTSEKNKQELNPIELTLNDEAEKLAIEALNQFETLMKTGNDLAELRDRTSKAVENACRIAGVMVVVEDGLTARVIDAERLGRALVIIQWYLAETLRIRGVAVIPQAVSDAESLLKWLDERGYKMFRSRQVLNKGPSQLRNKQRLDDAIKVLVENGYIVLNNPGTFVDGVHTRKSWSFHHVV